MSDVSKWNVISKTSLDSSHYVPVTGKNKFQLSSLLPSLATSGAGSESLYVSVTNGNQLNFKGIKSGDTGLLTVATASDNVVLTILESGIDLNSCDNTTAQFLKTVALASNVTGQLSVVNGGTGLSTISKGQMLYASADGTLAATSAMSTNGQVLIGNATSGVPTLATLTAGDNIAITNGAGSISIAANLTSAGAALDMNTYNINLDRAAGQSWVTGDGSDEGISVDADGKVILKDGTHAADTSGAQLSLQGAAATAIEIGNDAVQKEYTIKVQDAPSSAHSVGLNIKGGNATSGNTNGGHLTIKGGSSSGTGTAGIVYLEAGDPGAGGTEAGIQLKTHAAGAAASTAFAVSSTMTTTYKPLLYSGVQVLTGAGAVDLTSPITHIVTTGANALTLADGIEGQTKMIIMKTDGGDGTLTPANFAQGTTITFDAVGESVYLLFTNGGWHKMGGHDATIA
jgi:hypothetical protein